MARLVLFFLGVIGWVILCPAAQADDFSQCMTATIANCEILGTDPTTGSMTQSFKLPDPLGTVDLPAHVQFFTGSLCIVDNAIRSTMQGLYAQFFDAFLTPFKAVLILYVCVYAISFIFGLVDPRDFILRLFKLAVVWALVSNDCFFYKTIYGGFISASNDLIYIVSKEGRAQPDNAADGEKQLYQSLDTMFTNQVGMSGLVGIGTLLLSNISSQGKGMFAAMLEFLGVGSMALMLLRTMVTLGIAMAAISFFLMFTTMFFSFFLFQSTKRLFDTWLSMLVSFVLQPFIIFVFLGMMAIVNKNAAPAGLADMKGIMEDAMGIIVLKPFQPEMIQGVATVNVYTLDRAKVIAFFNRLNPPIPTGNLCPDPPPDNVPNPPKPPVGCEPVQDVFLSFFIPKVMFWFVINMIMAGFIKEVPAIAQRLGSLGGFVSGPTLGATQDSMFGPQTFGGIDLPGISRGSGGETTSMLKDSLLRNESLRRLAAGGAAMGTAGALKGALEKKGRVRGVPVAAGGGAGADIENKAADGQVNRDGGRFGRAGTLGRLLGIKTVNRQGPTAGGIGSRATAMRDGPNAAGIGSELNASRDGRNVANVAGVAGAAARRETINDNFREMQKAQVIANENARRGAEVLSGIIPGITITAPPKSEKPKIRRDNSLNDVELLKPKSDGATYLVNGKQITVKKGEETRFLMQKIAEINKDIGKTKTMGARGGVELKLSLEQRSILEARLRTLLDEKRVLESGEQELERLRLLGDKSRQVEQIIKIVPRLVQRNSIDGINRAIAKLKASANAKKLTPLILDLEELKKTMAQRDGAVKNTPPPPAQQKPATPAAQAGRKNLAQLEKKVLDAIADIKQQHSDKQRVQQEMTDAENRLHTLVQNQDLAGVSNLIANLKASPEVAEYDSVVRELRVLNHGVEEVRHDQVHKDATRLQESLLADIDQKGASNLFATNIFSSLESNKSEEKREQSQGSKEFDKYMAENLGKAGANLSGGSYEDLLANAIETQNPLPDKKGGSQKKRNPNYNPNDPNSKEYLS